MNTITQFNKMMSEKGYSDAEIIQTIFQELEERVLDNFSYEVEFEETDFVVSREIADKLTETETNYLLVYSKRCFLNLANEIQHNPDSYAVVAKEEYEKSKNSFIVPNLKFFDIEDAEKILAIYQKEEEKTAEIYTDYKVKEYLLVKFSDIKNVSI